MDQLHTHHTPSIKSVWEIKASIFDIKNKIYSLLSEESLLERIKALENQYQVEMKKNAQNIQILLTRFKENKISRENFVKQRETQEQKLTDILDEIEGIKDELRLRKVIQHIQSRTLNKDIVELCENIDEKLWENIMNWGSNALWVYLVEESNYVLIKKSIWNFKFLWDLGYYYDWLRDTPNIPKVKNVFIHNAHTYILMEKASGISVESLSQEEIEAIPQKHFDDFVTNLQAINQSWLCIDPSKRSNFFYDKDVGFIFIDLGIGMNNIAYHNLEHIFLASLLGNTSNPPEKIHEKIKKAISLK